MTTLRRWPSGLVTYLASHASLAQLLLAPIFTWYLSPTSAKLPKCYAQLYASSNALPVFKTLVASLVAAAAAVPASYVSVVSVAAGSVITTTLMTFPAGSNYNTAQVWNCVQVWVG